MEDRPFPIQAKNTFDGRPATIPWSIAEIACEEHRRRYGGTQTADDYARRHGFGVYELADLLAGALRRSNGEAQTRAAELKKR